MRVTEVYDDLLSVLATVWPAKTQLPNPYALDDNPSLFLNDGYGIAIAGATSTERFATCNKKSIERVYTVWLTRRIDTTENNITALRQIEREMYEDQLLMCDSIEKDTDLQESAIKSVFSDDSGTQFIATERGKYYALASTVTVEYLETIT